MPKCSVILDDISTKAAQVSAGHFENQNANESWDIDLIQTADQKLTQNMLLLIVLNWFFNAFVLDMKLNMNFPFSRKF
jgi:hypothetical protein